MADSSWSAPLMGFWRRAICHIFPIITSLIIGAVGVWAYGNRANPREILSVKVSPIEVNAGGFLSVVYEISDIRECQGVVHRWIRDSAGTLYAISDATVFHNFYGSEAAKSYKFARELRVPRTTRAGPAMYHAQTERWCSPLQWFWPIVDIEEAPFTVLPPSTQQQLNDAL